jgi:opacity protein-like surface antigen
MFTDGSGVRVGDVFAAKLRAGVGYDRYNAYGMVGVTHGTTNLAGDDWGAVFGVGLDVLLTHYLVAGIQYNYYNYVDFNHTKIDADLSEVTVRLGYKF